MADESAALICPTCGQPLPEGFLFDKTGVDGPGEELRRWLPFNPPPPPGPEYLGETPVLDTEEWGNRSTRTVSAEKDYTCVGIGYNGYGDLVLHRADSRALVVTDAHLGPLLGISMLKHPVYGWRDINGLLKLLRLAEERGHSEAEREWLADFAHRLVRYLPPKATES